MLGVQFLMKVIFKVILFAVLVPGMLLTLPSEGSNKIVAALVHGVVFYLLSMILGKLLFRRRSPKKSTKSKKSKKGK